MSLCIDVDSIRNKMQMQHLRNETVEISLHQSISACERALTYATCPWLRFIGLDPGSLFSLENANANARPE